MHLVYWPSILTQLGGLIFRMCWVNYKLIIIVIRTFSETFVFVSFLWQFTACTNCTMQSTCASCSKNWKESTATSYSYCIAVVLHLYGSLKMFCHLLNSNWLLQTCTCLLQWYIVSRLLQLLSSSEENIFDCLSDWHIILYLCIEMMVTW